MFRKLIILALFGLLFAACSAPAQPTWKVQQVVDALKAAGLEVESPTAMTKADYGMAPLVGDEAIHFLIPSLGGDNGGRIFSFSNKDDQTKLATYYTSLGKASAVFFSYVFQKDNILVQINGSLPDDKAKAYQAALDGLK